MYDKFMRDASVLGSRDLSMFIDKERYDEAFLRGNKDESTKEMFFSAIWEKKEVIGNGTYHYTGDFKDCMLPFIHHYITFTLAKQKLPNVSVKEIQEALKKSGLFIYYFTMHDFDRIPENRYEWERIFKQLCLFFHISMQDEKGKTFMKSRMKAIMNGHSEEDMEEAARFITERYGDEDERPGEEAQEKKCLKCLPSYPAYYEYICTKLIYDASVIGQLDEFDDYLWKAACRFVLINIHPAYWLNKSALKKTVNELLPWDRLQRFFVRYMPEYFIYHYSEDETIGDIVTRLDDFVCVADAAMKMFPDEREQRKALALIEASFISQVDSLRKTFSAEEYLFKTKAEGLSADREREELAKERLAFEKDKRDFGKQKDTLLSQEDELAAAKEEIEALKAKLRKKENENAYLERQIESLMTFDDKDESPADAREVVQSKALTETEPSEEDIEEEFARLERIRKWLSGKKIALFGGHENLISKIKEQYPGWLFIGAHGKAKKEQLSGKDAIVFLTDHLAHATFNTARDTAAASDVPVCYVHGTNVDMLTENIYKAVSDAISYKKDEKE